MKFKSAIALLLVFLMVFGIAACSAPGVGTATGETPTASGSNTADDGKWMNVEGANGDPNLRLPKYDFPSDTVTYLCHFEIPQVDADTESSLRDVYKIKYKTTVVAPEERVNKLVSMVMGGDSPDIFQYDQFLPSLANKGYLQPWDGYIDFSLGLWTSVKSSLDNMVFKGKHYAIDVVPARWDVVWYNKEIFEENGVKTPREYYEEGNWNWNTFRDCAKALTIDADSNGEPELWGCAIDSLNCFVYTTGKDMVTLNTDGTATNNIKSQEIARAVQFYTDLNIKDKVVYQGNDTREQFVAGKIAIIIGGVWYRTPFVEMIKKDMLWFVPYPKDPQADKYYLPEGFGGTMLAKDCKNPQGAAACMVAGRYDKLDTNDNPPVSEEDAMKSWNYTPEMDKYIWDEFYKSDKSPVLSTWVTFNLGNYWGDIWFRPRQGEAWATIAAEISPKIDQEIEKVMEG